MDFQSFSSEPDISEYGNSYDASQDPTKRRSSSRSIKRRRFDDELVEYSTASPLASGSKPDKRVRTQSYTSPYSEMLAVSNMQPSQVPSPPPPQPESKRKHVSKLAAHSVFKRNKKRTHLSQSSTKDLGRWKPTDDLALIIGVQQTNDLRMVHRGIKFTCRFTLGEIQSRWYTLLYNAEISRIAVAAIKNLHPDLVETVRSKALFSNNEEELLMAVNSTSQPTLEKFKELLEQNPTTFYPSRTAKSLMTHWQLMKQYSLLSDQTVQALPRDDFALNFSDTEDLINDAELQDPRDDALDTELAVADRWSKKEIRLLENSLSRWQVLVESVVGGGAPDFDKQTLAVLRGRMVRYLMRSREITIGRSTEDHNVDVDLGLEGPAGKISRRQGTIRLRNLGDFVLSSEGKRPFYVDGVPVLKGAKAKLNHNSVVEISGLRFIFMVNQDLISAIRQEAVKISITNTP